jgi:signal transduction histidine kinase/ActR/RegA family two-component response regulator
LYGWQAAEAIGKTINELLKTETTQLAEITQKILDREQWQGELREYTKTGHQVTVEARWTLVRDEVGQPKFILTVDTDMTQNKQLEAQFYQAQRLESLGTLASGIAHDLNNVLTPILAISQLMRLRVPNLDTRWQDMLQLVEDSAKRGANMVTQILTFVRGTEGKRISLQVATLLQQVVTVIQQTLPKTIEIRQNLPEQPLWLVCADPTHIHQILINLCVNARDAMPNGGILTLSAENYYVDELFTQMNLNARVGKYLLLVVADTGTGIAPQICDRIFDPFFTTKDIGKGTGLGLSTVLGIVKDYEGFLQVSTEMGRGSQFKVYLPTIEGTTSETGQTQELLDGNGELVLIVDDDLAVQQANKSLLENHNYNTLVANDGIRAIALYVEHKDQIKLVLIDIMMPNMDGITAIQTIKKINPQVQIIAISGLSSHKESVLAAGASAFLAKPYTLEDLLPILYELNNSELPE